MKWNSRQTDYRQLYLFHQSTINIFDRQFIFVFEVRWIFHSIDEMLALKHFFIKYKFGIIFLPSKMPPLFYVWVFYVTFCVFLQRLPQVKM